MDAAFKHVEEGVVFQENYAAVCLRLVTFGSKVQVFYLEITEQTGGLMGEMRGASSDLLCWLTVIWTGAPTDSFLP